jgi:hypothetical protein
MAQILMASGWKDLAIEECMLLLHGDVAQNKEYLGAGDILTEYVKYGDAIACYEKVLTRDCHHLQALKKIIPLRCQRKEFTIAVRNCYSMINSKR